LLEDRRMMAGPQLAGILPDDGHLLQPNEVLNVAPQDLTFRFSEGQVIDFATVGGIQIWRSGLDGVFTPATASSDFNTSGGVVLRFDAKALGTSQNGLQLSFTKTDQGGIRAPQITVTGSQISVVLNTNIAGPTTASDLITALNNDIAASGLIKASIVSGNAAANIATPAINYSPITLVGANAASGIYDFNALAINRVRMQFTAAVAGQAGNGTSVVFTKANLPTGQLPVVTVSGTTVTIQLNNTNGSKSKPIDVVQALRNSPAASALVSAAVVLGDPTTDIATNLVSGASITLAGSNDVLVNPGYLGRGESDREVIARFKERLPDDVYRIDILGGTTAALKNKNGEAFNDGINFSRDFELDLGAQVIAVVPQPIDRSTAGTLSQRRNQIDVYFNNDNLNVASATNPQFYKLIFTRDTAENTDDVEFTPSTVSYDAVADKAVLTFPWNIDQSPAGAGTYRLRIGTNEATPAKPQQLRPVATVSSDLNTGGQVNFQFDAVTPGEAGGGITVTVARANLGLNVPPSVNVYGNQISVIVNNSTGSRTTAQQMVDAINTNAASSALVRASIVSGNGAFDMPTVLATAQRATLVWAGGLGSTFSTSTDLGTLTSQSVVYSSAIDPQVYRLNFPGDVFEPGHRDIEVPGENHLSDGAADLTAGISTVAYNFGSLYGYDPKGNPLFNLITENQKQRTREAFEAFSRVAGIQFVETAASGITVVTGDLRAIDPLVPTGVGFPFSIAGSTAIGPTIILEAVESWDDKTGGTYFQRVMHEIGSMLGLGATNDLPPGTVMGNDGPPPVATPLANVNGSLSAGGTGLAFDNTIEPIYPSDADIVHLQRLYRPESKDIDMFQFTLDRAGEFVAETTAERRFDSSLLNTALRLWKEVDLVDDQGNVIGTRKDVIAQNDDSFSKDSLLKLNLTAGKYWLGVSASGNTAYDPTISDSGMGGKSQGGYDLRFNFRPAVTDSIVDATGVALDGDGDGIPGGVYNYWFRAVAPADQIVVDKTAVAGGSGTLTAPRNNLGQALTAATAGKVVRVVGNPGLDNSFATLTDNVPYEIGFNATTGAPLSDGSTLDVPKGVTVMIDAGAIFKMRRSAVNVGSTSPTVDRSAGALQVLGTPVSRVYFTSYDDATIGKDTNPDTILPQAGNWGGLAFRNDVDGSDATRFNWESRGIFLNYVGQTDLRYGGGNVTVASVAQVVNPIYMLDSRPTVTFNQITLSADAAMSATPNSFKEDDFNAPEYQLLGREFTADYSRVGPQIYGNSLVDPVSGKSNSINGLLVRVTTRAGESVRKLTVAGRFDDTDIAHVIAENLIVDGTPGGPLEQLARPTVSLVTATRLVGGGLTTFGPGNFNYRVTFVDASGNEGNASVATATATIAAGDRVRLTNLPTAPTGFSRRIYRSSTTAGGPYSLIAQINATDTQYIDNGTTLAGTLDETPRGLRPRLDARLQIDPAVVVKLSGAGISANPGGQLIIEAKQGLESVLTSIADDRFGAGGTFLTKNDGVANTTFNSAETNGPRSGDWSGIYLYPGSSASMDHAVIAGAGGITRVEGTFTAFNAVEVHQATARIAHSTFEYNENGLGGQAPTGRLGRGFNEAASIFVRGAQPVIVSNTLRDNLGPAISINTNALNSTGLTDYGRQSGLLNAIPGYLENTGPLIRLNRIDNNEIGTNAYNGMVVRGETLTTESIWDDTDIVHILQDMVYVYDYHTFGGLKLLSSPQESLVVKLKNGGVPVGSTAVAGITVNGRPLEITDRIGGILQVIGQPGYAVVMTSLADDTVGAGYRPDGSPQTDTNNDGVSFANVVPGTGGGGGSGNVVVATPVTSANALRDFLLGPGVLPVGDATLVSSATSAGTFVGGASSIGIDSGVLLTTGDVAEANGPNLFDGGSGFASGAGDTDLDATSGFTTLDSTVLEFDFTTTSGELYFNFVFGSEEYNEFANSLFNDVFAFYVDGRNIAFIPGTTTPVTINTVNGGDPIGTGAVNPQFYNNNDLDDNGLFLDEVGYDGFTDVFTAAALNLSPGTHRIKLAISDVADSILDSGVFLQAGSFSNKPLAARPQPGDWQGLKIDENAHDRNVETILENDPRATSGTGSNGTPYNAQFLGDLGAYQKAGDENLRLGFTVRGAILNPGDIDVYSFRGTPGTPVWIDIDRTTHALDTVVELVDDNGEILALSDQSTDESEGSAAVYSDGSTLVSPLSSGLPYGVPDRFTTNPRDAGMKVILPGQGDLNTYHVRVRSSNLSAGDPAANLREPLLLGAGLTKGTYQLQIRLQELDEVGGTTVRYSDVRYANVGIQVLGQPGHSPLLGEAAESETTTGTGGNNSPVTADPIGNLLTSDRGAISVAGAIGTNTDIDWYQLDVNYAHLSGASTATNLISTAFDIDYADGMARPDLSLAVFNSAGRLVYLSGDSNLGEDRPQPLAGPSTSDLARGSVGALDPYIGSVPLPEGTYFVAVANKAFIPSAAAQVAVRLPANPFLRLEPNTSVIRVVEDHLDSTPISTVQLPLTSQLVNNASIVPFNLANIPLFVSYDNNFGVGIDQSTLATVNAFTGAIETFVNSNATPNGFYNFDVGDIAMRADGRLYAFSLDLEDGTIDPEGPTDAESGNLINIDTGTGNTTVINDDGIATFIEDPGTPGAAIAAGFTPNQNGVGMQFLATTFTPPNLYGSERLLAVGYRPDFAQNNGVAFTRNVLYQFTNDVNSGTNLGVATPNPGDERYQGAGTDAQERGRIVTGGELTVAEATFRNLNPTAVYPNFTTFNITDSLPFTINDGFQDFTFEFDSGPDILQNINELPTNPDPARTIRDGQFFLLDPNSDSTSTGDETIFQFDTGPVLIVNSASIALANQTFSINDTAGQTETFEFIHANVNGGQALNPNATTIDITGNLTPVGVAGLMAAAITGGGTNVVAAAVGNRVTLTNDNAAQSSTGLISVNGDRGSAPILEAPAGTQLTDVQTFTLQNAGGALVRFQFSRTSTTVSPGNVWVPYTSSMSPQQVAASMQSAIAGANMNVTTQLVAPAAGGYGRLVVNGRGLTFTSASPVVNMITARPGRVFQIPVEENMTADQIGLAVEQVVNSGSQFTASSDVSRINFPPPKITNGLPNRIAAQAADFNGVPNWVDRNGAFGVAPGHIAVPFWAADSASEIALQAATAINNQNIPGVSATASGISVIVDGLLDGSITTQSPFTGGGTGPGGFVTGMAGTTSGLYVVSSNGGLYRINPDLDSAITEPPFQRTIPTTYISSSANDLLGIRFAALAAGPRNVENGRYANLLFGMDRNGRLYAFNTQGVLQPIFVDGQTSVDTGIRGVDGFDGSGNGGIQGIAFSTLNRNLWNITPTQPVDSAATAMDVRVGAAANVGDVILVDSRQNDPGHGVLATADTTRAGNSSPTATPPVPPDLDPYPTAGMASLMFGQGRVGNVARTYDFPGGAAGTVVTNEFSLEGYTSADQPVLYFNYFSNNEDADGATTNYDSFRVFVGVNNQWTAVAYNDNASGGLLWDNTNTWRQARVDLSGFAGLGHLKLRFDFSTAGDFNVGDPTTGGSELWAKPGTELRDGQTFQIDNTIFEFEMGYTIVPPSGAALVDGETFQITDRNGNSTTYEFDRDDLLNDATHVRILLDATQTPADLARLISQAIQLNGPSTVTPHVSGNRVNLQGATAFVQGLAPNETQLGMVLEGNFGATPTYVSVPIHQNMTATQVATAIDAALEPTFHAQALIASSGLQYRDGDAFQLSNGQNTFNYEFESGLILSVPNSGGASINDGDTITIYNEGTSDVVILEFNKTGGVQPGRVAVPITNGSSQLTVATAIRQAMRTAAATDPAFIRLGVDNPVVLSGSRVQIFGASGVRAFSSNNAFSTTGQPGVSGSVQFQVPGALGIRVPASGALALTDRDNFTVSDGVNSVTFEMSSDGLVTPGRVLIPFSYTSPGNSAAEIAQAIRAAIANEVTANRLVGLAPVVRGSGSNIYVDLGSDFRHTLNTSSTALIGLNRGGNVVDGEQFTLGDATKTITFELDTNGAVVPGNVAISFVVTDDPDVIASSIAAAIQAQGFTGFNAATQPLGIVTLGESTNEVVTTSGLIGIQRTGAPGDNVYPVRFSPSANFNAGSVASAIATAINASPLGVTANTFTHSRARVTLSGPTVTLKQSGNVVSFLSNPPLSFEQTNDIVKSYRDLVRIYNHTVTDPGPLSLVDSLDLDIPSDVNDPLLRLGYNNNRKGQANLFEGVYLDDFIIGFAERGELVTGAVQDTSFVANPELLVTDILTGPYQLEVRQSQSFSSSTTTTDNPAGLNGSMDTNDRLAQGVRLLAKSGDRLTDGKKFSLSNGVSTVTFEYEDLSILSTNPAFGVEPGNVALGFNPTDADHIVAATIRDAINSPAVQSVLPGISAALSDGTDGVVRPGPSTDNRVDIFGRVTVQGFGLPVPEANDTIETATTTTISGLNSTTYRASGAIGDNPQFGLETGRDVDLFEVYLNAGETLSIDVDANEIGSSLNPVLAVFNAAGTPLAFNNTGRGPNELFSTDAFLNFTAVIAGKYYIGVSGFNGTPVAAPFSVYNPNFAGSNAPGSTGFYELSLTFGDPTQADFQYFGGYGDQNHFRDQGQIVIQANRVSYSANFGIDLGPGAVDATSGAARPGAVRNLQELNYDKLAPGVVVTNNLLAFNLAGGVQISGSLAPDAPVPFARIVNNTVFGNSGTLVAVAGAPDVGINVRQNASPTLLNNVVANAATGIRIDGTSATTVVGASVYQGNRTNTVGVTGEDFPIILANTDPLFVNAATGNFYPAQGSRTIDSSIDSLLERASLETVKAPLGITPSPILAPQRDLFGLLRVDDPNTSPPVGFGENVFKDRGAIDRSDFSGPAAGLINPQDKVFSGTASVNDPNSDSNGASSVVQLPNIPLSDFSIQLVDGVEPADPQNGVGVDDSTVGKNKVLVLRDNRLLVEGIDYKFTYDTTNKIIRIVPLAGVWETNHAYQIDLVNRDQFTFSPPSGDQLTEGQTFTVSDDTTTTTFEFDSGYVLQVPQAGVADAQRFSIRNGLNPAVTFEFNRVGGVSPGNVAIPIGSTATQNDIANAIVTAVKGVASLALNPVNASGGKVWLGGTSNHFVDVTLSTLTLQGAPGVQTPGAIAVPFVPGTVPGTTPAAPVMSSELVAQAVVTAISGSGLNAVRATTRQYSLQGQATVEVVIRGATDVTGFATTFTSAIRDLAGNDLKANQLTGETTFTILLGNGSDYGDAPASYSTTGVNAARHAIASGFYLGALVDAESDGQATLTATGDDVNGSPNDEDGVVFNNPLFVNGAVTIVVTANKAGVAAGQPAGFLDGFVDFNRDGDLDDPADRVFSSRALVSGANTLTFVVPSAASLGSTFARFRYSSTGGLNASGTAVDGEVEDYQLTINGPPWQNLAKPLDVNNDNFITPLDSLLVVNFLNAYPGVSALPNPPPFVPIAGTPIFPDNPGTGRDYFIDVNGDGFISPLDALLIINTLNSGGGGESAGEGEGDSVVTTSSLTAADITSLPLFASSTASLLPAGQASTWSMNVGQATETASRSTTAARRRSTEYAFTVQSGTSPLATDAAAGERVRDSVLSTGLETSPLSLDGLLDGLAASKMEAGQDEGNDAFFAEFA
jgi:hypothetical protein